MALTHYRVSLRTLSTTGWRTRYTVRRMLRLMDVRTLADGVRAVTLDRDGTTRRYEFTICAPSRPGLPRSMESPDQVVWDLLDYEWKSPPGQPHGAIWIPVLDEVTRIVYRVADGEPIEFPIVLDER